MSAYRKGQQVGWGELRAPVTVLAGPFNGTPETGSGWYVVQQSNRYASKAYASDLHPLPPQVGDKGVVMGFMHARVIREANDDYVVTEITRGSYQGSNRFDLHLREAFDRDWRPVA